jgi:hypothetical protein
MRTLLLMVLLLLPPAVSAAEPVGRLFFSPEQRAQLDALRTRKVVAAQAKDEPAPEFVTYSGLIRRGDGKTTVWVNNKAITERDLRETDSLVGRIERDGRIVLQMGQTAGTPSQRLKVGQRVELGTGRVEENYAVTNAPPVRAPLSDNKKPAAEAKEKDNETAADSVRDGQKPADNPQPAARPEK